MLEQAANVTIWIAFFAGILSFISPCTLPLYPAFISYITGVSVNDIKNQQTSQVRKKVLIHTIMFLIGISITYYALALSASAFGQFFLSHANQLLIQRISAVLIIAMGLFLLGIFKFDWLMKERRWQFSKKPVGYLGSIIIGVGFAAGWTPCIGPILSVIIILVANEPAQGLTYMTAYILGFSLPFILLSLFIGSTRWIIKYTGLIMKIGGVVMIIMGVLLYTDRLIDITIYLFRLFDGTWLGRLG